MSGTSGQPGGGGFDPAVFLPRRLYEAITEVRVQRPELIFEEAARRRRRDRLSADGKLVILATDHPGRRVTGIPGDPLGMGDRHSYLARALRVLLTPGCDGIMGTTDFMEDLLILNALVREKGGPPLVDDKVLVGCMNRGGQAGVAGEIDDRFTSFTARQLAAMRFEGGKLMYRLDAGDPLSIKAVADCAVAINELHRRKLYAFLEPMSVRRKPEGGYETVKTVEALVKDAGAAAALGESSARTFLKLSYTDGYERVARATTLPILMLGGPPREDPASTLADFASGMRAAANVRGVLAGRNVTFAPGEDPRAVAAAVAAIVHEGADAGQAMEVMRRERSRGMDALDAWR
jgi:DhnA family fructose-bisphosphate aldolase class Ia